MEHLERTWWLPLVRGIVAILFGILALICPAITLLVIVTFFGALVLVDGIFWIFSAFRHGARSRVWPVVVGVVGILARLAALTGRWITSLALLYVVAFCAILTGLAELVDGIQIRKVIENEWTFI